MSSRFLILSCISLGLLTTQARGEVRLPRLVSDHMVLQRDSKIQLWGWAQSGEEVRIDFHGKKVTTRPERTGRGNNAAYEV